MLRTIRLRNLRSIVDSGPIELRRLNLLLGQNSSGKSTLLRLLPMMKQSTGVSARSPLLWYGRLVDFGTFNEAISSAATDETITVEFTVSLDKEAPARALYRLSQDFGSRYGDPEIITIGLQLIASGVKKIWIEIFGDVIELEVTNSQINRIEFNRDQRRLPRGAFWYLSSDSIIPNFTLLRPSESDPPNFDFGAPFLVQEVVEIIEGICHGNTSKDTIKSIASGLYYDSPEKFRLQISSHPHAPQSLIDRVMSLGSDPAPIDEIRRLTCIAAVSKILRDLSSKISNFASGVRYIEPVRAAAERFYRYEDLQVGEIDSRGANTAMFLNSLSASEKKQLQAWMQEHLGFSAYTNPSASHLSIYIREESGRERNISDLGFGFSQVLPVILQLWHCSVRKTLRRDFLHESGASVIAIEQPELHLHPALQSLLGNALGIIASSSDSVPLVIETHSEHLVNKIGQLIADGKLRPESAQVFLFDRAADISTISQVDFDENGVLAGAWPVGFFSPEV